MYRAFPGSDYYGGSAPARRRQPTLGLACPKRRGGHRTGSHVHCCSVNGGGAQLFPCGPVATITQTLAALPGSARYHTPEAGFPAKNGSPRTA